MSKATKKEGKTVNHPVDEKLRAKIEAMPWVD